MKCTRETIVKISIIAACVNLMFSLSCVAQNEKCPVLLENYNRCQSDLRDVTLKLTNEQKIAVNLKGQVLDLNKKLDYLKYDIKRIKKENERQLVSIKTLKEKIQSNLVLIDKLRAEGVEKDSIIATQQETIEKYIKYTKDLEDALENLRIEKDILNREREISQFLIHDFAVFKERKSVKGIIHVQFSLKSSGDDTTRIDTIPLFLKVRQRPSKGSGAIERDGWVTIGASGLSGAGTERKLNYAVSDNLAKTRFEQTNAFSTKSLKSNQYEVVVFFKSNSGGLIPIDRRKIRISDVKYFSKID